MHHLEIALYLANIDNFNYCISTEFSLSIVALHLCDKGELDLFSSNVGGT
jgi:hypothetical protein